MFELWIKQLLKSAIMAQASVQLFSLDEKAADLFAQRALNNIKKGATTPKDIYAGAARAVASTEQFLNRLYTQTRRRNILNEADAANSIREIRTTDCVYPWCTDMP